MSAYEKTFAWIDFPEGRVRYTGGAANREEPKEAFAIELRGQVYYGQIKEQFSPNGNDYNLEIVSFGWPENGWFGIEPNPKICTAFTFKEIKTIQTLLYKAIQIWRQLEHRPIFLSESMKSHFMGEIMFRDGWVLVKDEVATP